MIFISGKVLSHIRMAAICFGAFSSTKMTILLSQSPSNASIKGSATAKIIAGREIVKAKVLDLKAAYAAKRISEADYADAKNRYDSAMSKYSGWVGAVKGAIRDGELRALNKDAEYKATST